MRGGGRARTKQETKNVLLRPTASFLCEKCTQGPHTYPEINEHWQKEHSGQPVWMDDSSETVYGATVWEGGARTAQEIFAVLVDKGLPKDKRDMLQLDELIKARCVAALL